MYSTSLFRSIVNDSWAHPERLNATLERIQEVLEVVLKQDAPPVIAECVQVTDKKRDTLTDGEGIQIAKIISRCCSVNQIKLITSLLADSEISTAEAIDLHERFKIPVSRLEKDIVPVRGDGAWITDIEGRAYLDMDSNYSATNLGMSNPEIAKGISNQARQLISMKEDRVHIPRARFLKTIHSMLPAGLTQFYWQNSGGEAVDKALKIAKAYTDHKGVVAMKGGFHGRTHGAVAVTFEPKYRKPFFLDEQDWVHFVDFNDVAAVESLFVAGKARTVILELVQGEEGGIRPADPEIPAELRRICNSHQAVMIVDEIQTGFGRTAEKEGQWFASDVYGIVPDIMTIGKSFGGGYPVTAVVTNKTISDAMIPGYDGSTFGGNPMAMVAAMIATRQMRELNITRNVVERSAQIMKGLTTLKKRHRCITDIRGLGLMIAFQLPSAGEVDHFQQGVAKRGVKTSLSTREWVRFLPLLVISQEDVDFLLEAVDETLEDMYR
ncbi:aminotransferase class III-fold pyridoxal phosphate-dependent enzyme [bacterium]|nr:aminotransferase class III-fold pyridoxal phosphate-dependent enzyme [bacterium]MBU1984241.1 aminotransferase class III-fold pyridoxal phosphate-dependent enzyme [bacterium]